jgi:hypothetical protein
MISSTPPTAGGGEVILSDSNSSQQPSSASQASFNASASTLRLRLAEGPVKALLINRQASFRNFISPIPKKRDWLRSQQDG